MEEELMETLTLKKGLRVLQNQGNRVKKKPGRKLKLKITIVQ